MPLMELGQVPVRSSSISSVTWIVPNCQQRIILNRGILLDESKDLLCCKYSQGDNLIETRNFYLQTNQSKHLRDTDII